MSLLILFAYSFFVNIYIIRPSDNPFFNISIGSPLTTGRSRVIATADAVKKKNQQINLKENITKKSLFCVSDYCVMHYCLLLRKVWRAFNFMRRFIIIIRRIMPCTSTDDATTVIIQASLGPWFPRPTRKAQPPSGRGFVLFLVLQVEHDLHHLFEKQHPNTGHSRRTFVHKTRQRLSTTSTTAKRSYYTYFPMNSSSRESSIMYNENHMIII